MHEMTSSGIVESLYIQQPYLEAGMPKRQLVSCVYTGTGECLLSRALHLLMALLCLQGGSSSSRGEAAAASNQCWNSSDEADRLALKPTVLPMLYCRDSIQRYMYVVSLLKTSPSHV
jgi:hypothetical protein